MKDLPLIVKRPTQFTGSAKSPTGSYTICVPMEWYKMNKLDPKKFRRLTFVIGKHIVILNPTEDVVPERVIDFVKNGADGGKAKTAEMGVF